MWARRRRRRRRGRGEGAGGRGGARDCARVPIVKKQKSARTTPTPLTPGSQEVPQLGHLCGTVPRGTGILRLQHDNRNYNNQGAWVQRGEGYLGRGASRPRLFTPCHHFSRELGIGRWLHFGHGRPPSITILPTMLPSSLKNLTAAQRCMLIDRHQGATRAAGQKTAGPPHLTSLPSGTRRLRRPSAQAWLRTRPAPPL